MTTLPTVFVTYNPHSEVEQTLAIRLHSIGAVHGYNMLLPDRSFSLSSVSSETRARILSADFFILFSTTNLSPMVMEEINIAFGKHHDRSRILIVYDQNVGKNTTGFEKCTEVFVDTRKDPSAIVDQITRAIPRPGKPNGGDFLSQLGGILLIGAGLLALTELFDSPPPRRRTTTTPRKRKAVRKKKV